MGIELATAVGLGLSAAGTAASVKAAHDSKKAMNRQTTKALAQQEEFQRQATPIAQDSINRAGPSQQGHDSATGKNRSLYESASLSDGRSALPGSDKGAQGRVQQFQTASAKGEGYADESLKRWLRQSMNSTRLGVISNLARSAAGTAPILTALAGNKGANLAGIGSLLSTAGNLSAIYGGVNAKKPVTVSQDQTTPLMDLPQGRSTVSNIA